MDPIMGAKDTGDSQKEGRLIVDAGKRSLLRKAVKKAKKHPKMK